MSRRVRRVRRDDCASETTSLVVGQDAKFDASQKSLLERLWIASQVQTYAKESTGDIAARVIDAMALHVKNGSGAASLVSEDVKALFEKELTALIPKLNRYDWSLEDTEEIKAGAIFLFAARTATFMNSCAIAATYAKLSWPTSPVIGVASFITNVIFSLRYFTTIYRKYDDLLNLYEKGDYTYLGVKSTIYLGCLFGYAFPAMTSAVSLVTDAYGMSLLSAFLVGSLMSIYGISRTLGNAYAYDKIVSKLFVTVRHFLHTRYYSDKELYRLLHDLETHRDNPELQKIVADDIKDYVVKAYEVFADEGVDLDKTEWKELLLLLVDITIGFFVGYGVSRFFEKISENGVDKINEVSANLVGTKAFSDQAKHALGRANLAGNTGLYFWSGLNIRGEVFKAYPLLKRYWGQLSGRQKFLYTALLATIASFVGVSGTSMKNSARESHGFSEGDSWKIFCCVSTVNYEGATAAHNEEVDRQIIESFDEIRQGMGISINWSVEHASEHGVLPGENLSGAEKEKQKRLVKQAFKKADDPGRWEVLAKANAAITEYHYLKLRSEMLKALQINPAKDVKRIRKSLLQIYKLSQEDTFIWQMDHVEHFDMDLDIGRIRALYQKKRRLSKGVKAKDLAPEMFVEDFGLGQEHFEEIMDQLEVSDGDITSYDSAIRALLSAYANSRTKSRDYATSPLRSQSAEILETTVEGCFGESVDFSHTEAPHRTGQCTTSKVIEDLRHRLQRGDLDYCAELADLDGKSLLSTERHKQKKAVAAQKQSRSWWSSLFGGSAAAGHDIESGNSKRGSGLPTVQAHQSSFSGSLRTFY